MSARCDVLVVGGGPVGACAAQALAADGASVTLIEKEGHICPPVGGAHANCGLLVPSDVTPLAAPGALGQGLRWMLDNASPFYIAPRPSGALLRWLWFYRAAATPARARAAAPVLRDLQAASADLHDALARDGGERWLYHHDGIV
jgi:D-amino-acid dehydrogenase